MSHEVLEDLCIGCGGCEYACSQGALTKTDSFLGLFVIDPFTCNDCGDCVAKCPVDAIVIDPDWAVCGDRGCPLSSQRLESMDCSYWQQRCPSCGTTMWRPREDDEAVATAEQAWSCPKCGMGMKVACPRTRKLGQVAVAPPRLLAR